jgi:segregation and condensation protein B
VSERARQPEPEELRAVVGAVLFASDEPVQPKEIAAAVGGVEVAEVERAIDELQKRCKNDGLGLRVERIAGGVQMATSSDVAPWVRQFFREQNRKRLSPPALETLAIVAYRQPVTVPEIQAIRGKDPTAALRGLVDRKLVQFLGRKKVVGNPLLYGTSKEFLVHFGLDSLDDLPPIEDFDQFVGAVEERVETIESEEPAGDA